MRVMALFLTLFFTKCLRVDEDGPGRGHPCHIDTFLVKFLKKKKEDNISREPAARQMIYIKCQALFSSKKKSINRK